ncbi:hypothetical protein ULMS_08130 [Patiriisocius marinistellae]|uniref:AP2/ERF domain-containing protein n=1 Tax=Patiriisocius marinistellae TaxID=2494560 RepID=A0A5J4FZ56_9FLAO|nr:hypothetical protein [Patiriisocius marinistellae]GEQ85305.1 hypothetical protein ULMS_08130 [Patiriisocius marinistellae]
MKTSRNILLLALIANTMTSCLLGSSTSDQESNYGYEDELAFSNQDNLEQDFDQHTDASFQGQSNTIKNKSIVNLNNGGKKNYVLTDPSTGQSLGTMPIPSSWQPVRNSKEFYLQGPGGVKIYNDMSNFFHYSNDASYNQIIRQNGNQVKPTMTMEQFFNKEFLPMAQKEGAKLINKTPLPSLAQKDKQVDGMFYKGMPEQTHFEAMLTEWIDKDGKPGIIVIKHRVSNYGQGRQSWGYTYSGMDAEKQAYQKAKAAFLHALQNAKLNPQYVQITNQKNRIQSDQITKNHIARMGQIKSYGDAQTKLHQTYSDISDINHKGYMDRSAANSAGHSKYINSINEVQTGTVNGTTYQVDGYANNTWVNQSNEYIQSNDHNYDPNIYGETNNSNWQQMDYNDDGY